MGSAVIFLLPFAVGFVNASIHLTKYAGYEHNNNHDCVQLFSCGALNKNEVRSLSECGLLALVTEAGMIIYGEGNRSCLLCLPGKGFVMVVQASDVVYVEGIESLGPDSI